MTDATPPPNWQANGPLPDGSSQPERVRAIDLPVPARALAIGAHPDDIEFGCGATLAKWAAAGCVINHLVLTDGSKGTWDPDDDIAELIANRKVEQRAAADALGSTGEVVMLGHTDGELQSSVEIRGEVAYWIRKLRPEVVLGHDPWKRYRLHPDHRAAGWLTVDGVVAARDPHFHRDHDVPHHRPSTLLLFEADEPNHAEHVSGFGAAKVTALLQHGSQLLPTMGIAPDDDGSQRAAFEQKTLDGLRDGGKAAGLDEAELFHDVPGV